MNKKITAIIIVAVVIFGAVIFMQSKNATQKAAVADPKTMPTQEEIKDGDDSKVVLGVFEGTIPCADCEGIHMKLTLYQDPKTLGAAGYTLDSEYIGQPNGNFNEQGEWDYLRGNSKDPNATIYGLNLDQPKPEQQYFLKVGDQGITLLDINMNPIKSELNYTLMKNP